MNGGNSHEALALNMYLYGAGGHSKVITDILNSLGIEVIGVFDDRPAGAKLKTMAIDSGIRVQGETFPKN